MRGLFLILAVCLAGAVLACSGSDGSEETATATAPAGAATGTPAEQSATPRPSVVATLTSVPATASPESTSTREPTATSAPPTATPVPATATSLPPTATTAPPTQAPQPTQPPVNPGAQTLFLTAQNIKFTPTTLVVSSGASVTVVMTNNDTLVPHNVAFTGLGTSATCSGPCTASVSFQAPGPGSYGFLCTIHPSTMTGTLAVQ